MSAIRRWSTLPLVVAAVLLAWWAVRVTPLLRTAADDFMPARLFHDLVVAGGSLADWYLPAAPYWFPDLALYFSLLAAGMPLLGLSTAYALIIAAATVAAAWWLALRLYPHTTSAWMVALAMVALLVALGEAATFWNRPIFHYGVFLNALLAAACLLRCHDRPILLVPLFAVVVAAVASDFLFIPVIVAASTAGVLVIWLTNSLSFRALLPLPVVAVAVLSGYAVYFLGTPHAPDDPTWASGLHLRYGLFHPLTHLEGIRFTAGKLFDPYYAVVLLTVIAALAATWRRPAPRNRYLSISAFFLGGMLANLHVVGLNTDPGAFARYSLFATNGAIAWAAISIGFVIESSPWLRRGAPYVLPAAIAGALALSESKRHAGQIAELLKARDCLVGLAEREGLRYGLASYDDANRYTVLTGHRLELRPVRGDSLSALRWQRSNAWNAWPVRLVLVDPPVPPDVYAGRRLSYPLDESVATGQAGAPASRHACPGVTALIYPPGRL